MKTRSCWLVLLPPTWLLLAGGLLAVSHCPAQAQGWSPVINITNHIWKYLVEGGDQGTAWREPEFDDSSWNSGIGLFGFESTPAVYPYPFQTTWQPIDGRLTYYVRTHFQWVGPLNWPDVLLRTTNYIDDGAVFYLNGREVGRVRLPTNVVIEFNTPALVPPVEGQPDILEFRGSPRRGDNVLAVEVHNATPLSHDIVFGLSMEGIECHFDFLANASPGFQTVEQCKPATITLVGAPSFGPGMSWMKNGMPIPTATNNVLYIPQVGLLDSGEYYVEVLTPCGPRQSTPSLLVVSPDATPPRPLRAMADSTLTNFTITFSEPLDLTSIDATNFIVDDVCLPGRLKTQFATLMDPTNVLVTTTPRRLDQNYVVMVSGIRDACAGNTLTTNATVLLEPMLPLESLRLTRSLSGLQISWTGCGVLQWTSNLVHWADVPGVLASPYDVGSAVDTRFYRLRLP
jgi:hypothetical protein